MINVFIIVDVVMRLASWVFIYMIGRYILKGFAEFFKEEPDWQLDLDDDDDWSYEIDDYEPEEPLFLCTCGEWVCDYQMQKITTKNGSYWVCDYCVF